MRATAVAARSARYVGQRCRSWHRSRWGSRLFFQIQGREGLKEGSQFLIQDQGTPAELPGFERPGTDCRVDSVASGTNLLSGAVWRIGAFSRVGFIFYSVVFR